jgi:hypothetical protein
VALAGEGWDSRKSNGTEHATQGVECQEEDAETYDRPVPHWLTPPAKSPLERALELAKQGFLIIAACAIENGDGTWRKPPLVGEGWPELATTDPERVTSWWRGHPHALVAVVMGRPHVDGGYLYAIDVDAAEALVALRALGGEWDSLSTTAVVRTPRGLHLVYRSREPLPDAIGLLGIPHLDARGAGGYSVVAGLRPDGASWSSNLTDVPWLPESCEAVIRAWHAHATHTAPSAPPAPPIEPSVSGDPVGWPTTSTPRGCASWPAPPGSRGDGTGLFRDWLDTITAPGSPTTGRHRQIAAASVRAGDLRGRGYNVPDEAVVSTLQSHPAFAAFDARRWRKELRALPGGIARGLRERPQSQGGWRPTRPIADPADSVRHGLRALRTHLNNLIHHPTARHARKTLDDRALAAGHHAGVLIRDGRLRRDDAMAAFTQSELYNAFTSTAAREAARISFARGVEYGYELPADRVAALPQPQEPVVDTYVAPQVEHPAEPPVRAARLLVGLGDPIRPPAWARTSMAYHEPWVGPIPDGSGTFFIRSGWSTGKSDAILRAALAYPSATIVVQSRLQVQALVHLARSTKGTPPLVASTEQGGSHLDAPHVVTTLASLHRRRLPSTSAHALVVDDCVKVLRCASTVHDPAREVSELRTLCRRSDRVLLADACLDSDTGGLLCQLLQLPLGPTHPEWERRGVAWIVPIRKPKRHAPPYLCCSLPCCILMRSR